MDMRFYAFFIFGACVAEIKLRPLSRNEHLACVFVRFVELLIIN